MGGTPEVFVAAVVMSAGAAFAQPQLVGDEIPVNQRMIGPQRHADLCTRNDGSFVVVWADGRANGPGELAVNSQEVVHR